MMLDESRKVFRPELDQLRGRPVVFRLTRADVARILDSELAKLRRRVATRDIQIELDESAAAFLVEKGFDEKFASPCGAPWENTQIRWPRKCSRPDQRCFAGAGCPRRRTPGV